MRILYTTHQFLPEYSSGTEILTLSTAREMKERGHEVFILTGFPPRGEKGPAVFSDRYEYSGLTIDRFFCSQSPCWVRNRIQSEVHDPFFSRYFTEKLLEIQPDIVHFHHLQRLSAAAIDGCAKRQIPMVFTATDFWPLCPTNQLLYPNGAICDGPRKDAENCVRHLVALSQGPAIQSVLEKVPDFFLRPLIRCVRTPLFPGAGYVSYVRAILKRQGCMRTKFLKIDRVLTPTRFMMEKFLEFGLERDRILRVPFGIESTNGVHPSAEKGKREALTIGFIGTFYYHKGADVLVKAVRLAPADLPVSVKLYGALEQFPEYVKTLKTMAGKDERIAFCGTFPKERIGEVLEDLDILVTPSLWHENSPLVIHAAQAAGVPVVGSNIGGVNETIRDGLNGLLFERGDAEALSRILERVCRDRGLVRRLSENAQPPRSMVSYGNELEEIYAGLKATGDPG